MDLQEATLTMALLFKKEIDFHNEHIKDREENSIPKDLLKQYEYIRANTREFGNQLASDPNFFDIMESWMIVIYGREGVFEDSLQKAYKNQDVEGLLEKTSNLAMSVKRYIQSEGLLLAGIGAGLDGWDINVRCSEKRSRELCLALRQRFSSAMELKLLNISRRFAGHCLPGLYNGEDAK